jgi:hypothetical protein
MTEEIAGNPEDVLYYSNHPDDDMEEPESSYSEAPSQGQQENFDDELEEEGESEQSSLS